MTGLLQKSCRRPVSSTSEMVGHRLRILVAFLGCFCVLGAGLDGESSAVVDARDWSRRLTWFHSVRCESVFTTLQCRGGLVSML